MIRMMMVWMLVSPIVWIHFKGQWSCLEFHVGAFSKVNLSSSVSSMFTTRPRLLKDIWSLWRGKWSTWSRGITEWEIFESAFYQNTFFSLEVFYLRMERMEYSWPWKKNPTVEMTISTSFYTCDNMNVLNSPLGPVTA